MKTVHHLLLFGWLILALPPSSSAQHFYYGPDGRTYLEVSTEKVLVQFQPWVSPARQQALFDEIKGLAPLNPKLRLPAPRVVLAPLDGIDSEAAVYDLLRRLRNYPEIAYANHFLMHEDGTAHGITDRLLVRRHPWHDESLLQSTARAFGAIVEKQNEFDDQLYHLTVANPQTNALQLANQLHETGLFDYAEPDFLRLMKPMSTNDPFVDNQWALNNDGVNTSYWGGVAGADMKVFSAWASTIGATTIKVAILDEGVDLNHPDLIDNLLPGYDATGLGSAGGPFCNDAHGTACAGIVAATGNNGIGLAGVANSSKIIPVRIAYSNAMGSWVTSNAVIADAINWAWQTGEADVLSNAWGGGSPSSAINGAIDGAVTNGRDGLGAPVLFSTGNSNGSVLYPASYEPTISVIAMSMCNQRKSPSSCDWENWWGSNYGPGADIAAPGVNIYTTDISGPAGYGSGDYLSDFNGTSSACSNAAGVMALILSVNPGLTEDQARFILESTTDQVGGYAYSSVNAQPNGTWSQELGYGRVNAQAAVNFAAPSIDNDAAIRTIIAPWGAIRHSSAIPEVTLYNAGANHLTSATIIYQLDSGKKRTYHWTGSLPSLGSTHVALPSISYSSGSHTFTAYTSSPNGVADNNPANDDAGSSFTSGSNEVALTMLLDSDLEETTLDTRDSVTRYNSSGDGNFCGYESSYPSNPSGAQPDERVLDGDNLIVPAGNGNGTTNLALPGSATPAAIARDLPVDPDLTPELTVFPNPAIGRFNIRMTPVPYPTRLRLFDVQGRIVWEQRIDAGEVALEIDISDRRFVPGVYTIGVFGEWGVSTRRLLIQR